MKTLVKINWVLSTQFGLNLRRFLGSFRALGPFLLDWRRFRRGYSGEMSLLPCLHDRYAEGGSTRSEYFWQDLVVARWICEARPSRHVDVGSRVDGFVAHVASFREIEVFDVRSIPTDVPGIVFRQADITDSKSLKAFSGNSGYCDSLSCLHALEHFGLGRYGDSIDPIGYEKGFSNMATLLLPGGIFYLSTPIGRQRVEFNGNWVFDPHTILQCAFKNKLMINRLVVYSAEKGLQEKGISDESIAGLAHSDYNLAIFVFQKRVPND